MRALATRDAQRAAAAHARNPSCAHAPGSAAGCAGGGHVGSRRLRRALRSDLVRRGEDGGPSARPSVRPAGERTGGRGGARRRAAIARHCRLRGVRASPPCALASTCTGLALPVPWGARGARRHAAGRPQLLYTLPMLVLLNFNFFTCAAHARPPCTCAGPSAHGPRRGSTAVFGAAAEAIAASG